MKESRLKSWGMLLGIAILLILWGILIYLTVGDRGQPDWDFGAQKDVPGESPYSTSRDK
jgi:hypothetical protein